MRTDTIGKAERMQVSSTSTRVLLTLTAVGDTVSMGVGLLISDVIPLRHQRLGGAVVLGCLSAAAPLAVGVVKGLRSVVGDRPA